MRTLLCIARLHSGTLPPTVRTPQTSIFGCTGTLSCRTIKPSGACTDEKARDQSISCHLIKSNTYVKSKMSTRISFPCSFKAFSILKSHRSRAMVMNVPCSARALSTAYSLAPATSHVPLLTGERSSIGTVFDIPAWGTPVHGDEWPRHCPAPRFLGGINHPWFILLAQQVTSSVYRGARAESWPHTL